MKKLLLALLFPTLSFAASTPQEVTFTSTTSWVQVSALPTLPLHSVVFVDNETDGDIQVAFGATTYPDFTVKQSTSKTVDVNRTPNGIGPVLDYKAPMYVRNITGTGGSVIIKTLESGIVMEAKAGSGGGGGSVTVSNAVTTTPIGRIFETRFHNAASAGINASVGAWVEVETAAALAQAITGFHITTTIGEPLEFGTGASAGAVTRKWIVNRGEGPLVLGSSLASGTRLWVRSLTTTAVSAGEIVLNLGAL